MKIIAILVALCSLSLSVVSLWNLLRPEAPMWEGEWMPPPINGDFEIVFSEPVGETLPSVSYIEWPVEGDEDFEIYGVPQDDAFRLGDGEYYGFFAHGERRWVQGPLVAIPRQKIVDGELYWRIEGEDIWAAYLEQREE